MDRVRESGGRADEWGGRRWDECGRVEGGWTEHGMRRTGSVNQCIGRTHSGGELGFWVSWYQRAGRSAEGRGTQGKREAEAAGMSRMSTTRLNYVFLSWQRESEKTKHSGEGGGGVKDGGAAAPVADWLRAGGGGDDGVGSWVSAAGAGCGQSGGGGAARVAPGATRERPLLAVCLARGGCGGGGGDGGAVDKEVRGRRATGAARGGGGGDVSARGVGGVVPCWFFLVAAVAAESGDADDAVRTVQAALWEGWLA